ncbi:MAG TPA: hypothetical protein VIP11_00340 [Gemmatimonadaceae bacterium]
MKNPLSALVAVLLMALATRGADAQTFVGGSAGLSWSTVDWQVPKPPSGCRSCIADIAPARHRNFLPLALMAHHTFNRWVALGGDARYIGKGWDVTTPALHVDYIDVPVLLRLGPQSTRESPVGVFVEAGPGGSLRTLCDVSGPCSRRSNQDWRIRPFDLTANFGGALSLKVDRNLWIAGLRVTNGLLDMGGPDYPMKNRTFFVHVGWATAIGASANPN